MWHSGVQLGTTKVGDTRDTRTQPNPCALHHNVSQYLLRSIFCSHDPGEDGLVAAPKALLSLKNLQYLLSSDWVEIKVPNAVPSLTNLEKNSLESAANIVLQLDQKLNWISICIC